MLPDLVFSRDRCSTPHRRTLLRVIPIYLPPQSPSPCHSVPAGHCLTWPELGQPSAPSHNGQHHYLHSGGTTERTCPAVSSPEASRTPAARVYGLVLQRQASEKP